MRVPSENLTRGNSTLLLKMVLGYLTMTVVRTYVQLVGVQPGIFRLVELHGENKIRYFIEQTVTFYRLVDVHF